MFFGHNSEPCGNFGAILRHKLPIILPDLPIPTRSPNSSVQPEFLNPKCLCKTKNNSRVLTAERIGPLLVALQGPEQRKSSRGGFLFFGGFNGTWMVLFGNPPLEQSKEKCWKKPSRSQQKPVKNKDNLYVLIFS